MSRDSLLAIGVSLIVIGVILRGVARSNRRDQALRKQHRLDSPSSLDEPDRTDRHLEQNLPRYAAGCLIVGAGLIVAAFFR